jgi:hypothetical protein
MLTDGLGEWPFAAKASAPITMMARTPPTSQSQRRRFRFGGSTDGGPLYPCEYDCTGGGGGVCLAAGTQVGWESGGYCCMFFLTFSE